MIKFNEKREAFGIKQFIINRKKKGLYTLVFFAGLPGSGKSYSCMRLGEILSKKLTGSKKNFTSGHVFNDFVQLVQFIKDANPKEVNIGVIEEVSVLFPSRRAMAGANVDINKVLDTARKKQVILLANAPLWNSIDSHMKALGNLYVETLTIDKKNSVVIVKPLFLQTNPHSGKTYNHRLTYKGQDIHRAFFRRPGKEITKEYEKQKDKFMDAIYEKAIQRKQTKDKEFNKNLKKGKTHNLSRKAILAYTEKQKGRKVREIAKEIGTNVRYTYTLINKVKDALGK